MAECSLQSHAQPIRSCKRREVTELTFVIGAGTEGDPVREIRRYYDDDGRLLAVNDPGRDSALYGAGEVTEQ